MDVGAASRGGRHPLFGRHPNIPRGWSAPDIHRSWSFQPPPVMSFTDVRAEAGTPQGSTLNTQDETEIRFKFSTHILGRGLNTQLGWSYHIWYTQSCAPHHGPASKGNAGKNALHTKPEMRSPPCQTAMNLIGLTALARRSRHSEDYLKMAGGRESLARRRRHPQNCLSLRRGRSRGV